MPTTASARPSVRPDVRSGEHLGGEVGGADSTGKPGGQQPAELAQGPVRVVVVLQPRPHEAQPRDQGGDLVLVSDDTMRDGSSRVADVERVAGTYRQRRFPEPSIARWFATDFGRLPTPAHLRENAR
jgi:hypothetical protein